MIKIFKRLKKIPTCLSDLFFFTIFLFSLNFPSLIWANDSSSQSSHSFSLESERGYEENTSPNEYLNWGPIHRVTYNKETLYNKIPILKKLKNQDRFKIILSSEEEHITEFTDEPFLKEILKKDEKENNIDKEEIKILELFHHFMKEYKNFYIDSSFDYESDWMKLLFDRYVCLKGEKVWKKYIPTKAKEDELPIDFCDDSASDLPSVSDDSSISFYLPKERIQIALTNPFGIPAVQSEDATSVYEESIYCQSEFEDGPEKMMSMGIDETSPKSDTSQENNFQKDRIGDKKTSIDNENAISQSVKVESLETLIENLEHAKKRRKLDNGVSDSESHIVSDSTSSYVHVGRFECESDLESSVRYNFELPKSVLPKIDLNL